MPHFHKGTFMVPREALGLERRLRRLSGPNGRLFVMALDHGLPAGPLPGLEDPGALVARLGDLPVTALIVHSGIVRHVAAGLERRGLILHLSAGTVLGVYPRSKALATGVERAVSLGADAVSVQIHFEDSLEDRMIADAGRVVDAANGFGVPVLIMAYVAPTAGSTTVDLEAATHAARAAAEIGAQLVQIDYAGPLDGLRRIVRGCPVPIVLVGGPRVAAPGRWLDGMREAVAAGVMGLSIGRGLFQHEAPADFARQIGEVLFAPRPEAIASWSSGP